MKALLLMLVLTAANILPTLAQAPPLLSLRYTEDYSPTYHETIALFSLLAEAYPEAALVEAGLTDSGKPLHTFIISKNRVFDPVKLRAEGKLIILINNGIHPGEPEGIDASLKFADDILRNHEGMGAWLDQTVIVIVPVYNTGGALNRSAWNRSGQTTPYETGFRGNAANLDLNRDFTKCDSENARSFTRLFHRWNPDLFLDTHTTNGSDHQHAMTLIPPQPDQFPAPMREFLREKMLPDLYSAMAKANYPMVPYVDFLFEDIRDGIRGGQEGPRFSSGYAALFHSYGMMTENLIYASYPDRVLSTWAFIKALVKFGAENKTAIQQSREKGIRETLSSPDYTIAYALDTTRYQWIDFKGYEVDREQISEVTGLPRLGYDRNRPFEAKVRYFDTYRPVRKIELPGYYVVPSAWKAVRERLLWNGVEYIPLGRDTTITVKVDYFEEVSHAPRPYNGHYFHTTVVTRSEFQTLQYMEGDWLVPVKQEKLKYIVEMLEPDAKDSFFRWNFFDAVLDQREYFSSFGFEENALKTLQTFPQLRQTLDERRAADSEFATNHRAQLQFIYDNSPWLEKSWKRYPVGRIMMDSHLKK